MRSDGERVVATIAVTVRYASNIAEWTNNLKQGLDQIEATTAGAERMANVLGGQKLIQSAHNLVAAIDKLGGSTKLTAAEQERWLPLLDRAMAKMEAMGQTVPTSMRAMADSMRQPTERLTAMQQVQQHVEAQTLSMTGRVKEMALGFVSGQAAYDALLFVGRQYVEFLKGSITEALEADKVQRQLTAALRDQGTAVPTVLKLYDELATKYQNTTVHSDDAIKSSQALLAQVGGVMPAEMDKAVRAVTNLSAGLGIDLRSATLMVAKASEDNFAALQKQGVQIDTTRAKAEGFEYVLGQVNARFGGQAQAEVQSYTGQLKQLENQWKDLQEQVGKALIDSGTMTIAITGLKVAIGMLNQQLLIQVAAFKSMPSMTDLITSPAQAGAKWGREFATELKNLMNATTGAAGAGDFLAGSYLNAARAHDDWKQKRAAEEARKLEAANLAAAKATEAYTQKVVALRNEVSGQKLAADVRLLEDAYRGLTAEQKKNPVVLADMATRVDALVARGGLTLLSNQLRNVWSTSQQMTGILPKVTLGTEALERGMRNVSPIVMANWRAQEEYNAKLQAFDKIINTSAGMKALLGIGVVAHGPLIPPPTELEVWLTELDAVAAGFDRIASVSRGRMREVAGGITTGIDAVALFESAIETMTSKSASNLQKLQAGFNAVSAGVMMFNVFSSISDSLNRSAREQARFEALMKSTRDLAGQFDNSIGDVNRNLAFSRELIEQINRTGASLVDKTTASLRGIGSAEREAAAALNRQRAVALNILAIVDELGGVTSQNINDVLRNALPLFDLIRQGGRTGAEAQRVLNDLIRQSATELNNMARAALENGTKLPASMRPFFEELIRSGNLADDVKRKLLGLADPVPWREMEEAAGRYNIKVEDLGKTFAQAKFTDSANQIAKDWDLLTKHGADANVVALGMRDSIQKMVSQALSAGLEIPEGMRPVIDLLIRMGELTDENGLKLEDTSRINFAKPIADSIEDLIKKLDEFIDTLAVKLPKGAADGARSAQDELNKVKPPEFVFKTPRVVSENDSNVAVGHFGGMVESNRIRRFHGGTSKVLPFGRLASDEVPAILQVGEAVLSKNMVDAMSGGRHASAPPSVSVTIEGDVIVDSEKRADELAQKISAKIVEKWRHGGRDQSEARHALGIAS